jgi:hypothetical protein
MKIDEQIIRIRTMMGLNESVIYNFNKKGEGRYEFKTDDGLVYDVHILPAKGFGFKTYEVSFRVRGKGSEYETKLDLGHLNSVLNTVTDIVDNEVKDKKIRKVIFNPSYGERDVQKGDNRKIFNPNLRYELYLRFLTNRYPEDAVLPGMGNIGIDITKIYPEIFQESNKMSIIIELLNNFNDSGREIVVNDFDGEDENNFTYIGELSNSEMGDFSIEINVHDNWKEYNIMIESYDTGEKDEEYFKTFDKLIDFIKSKFV